MKNFTLSIFIFLIFGFSLHAQQSRNSYAVATATLFLDFDGHTVISGAWNAGNPLYCQPSGMTDAQVSEIFNRVAEDYRPFNINVTTDSTKFLAAPLEQRMRIIVTPTSNWYPGVGGISYIGSFTWGDDTPGFVFSDKLNFNPKYIAECCSHESGHTVGLSHQSTYDSNCNLIETYNAGAGSGEIGWAPVMGNSYYKNMTGWNDGPTPYGCASTQDNLTIITSLNGFGFRTDDFTDAMDNSTYTLPGTAFNTGGIITSSNDKDAFKYVSTQYNSLHIEVNPFGLNTNNTGANLDVKVELYDGNQTLIATYNPSIALNVVIDTSLNSGTYYFVVSGTGNSNISNYGSLGSYNITGFRGVLPIRDVKLSGSNNSGKHDFTWQIIADEAIKTQVLESSADGINFTAVANISATQKIFSYSAKQSAGIYYRLKVSSASNQVVYSNTIFIKAGNDAAPLFTVGNMVQKDIIVKAQTQFRYHVYDANAKLVLAGTGNKGINIFEFQNKPAGFYVIQFINEQIKQTERIIKQ
ncbi:MAG: type sorting protein [Ferruginibacter sp.]|nr:type sorting protein [Ferruginibacter sp.]